MKTSTVGLLFSLSIHAALGYSIFSQGPGASSSLVEPIEISEVRYEKPTLEEKRVAPAFAPLKREPVIKTKPLKARPSKAVAPPAPAKKIVPLPVKQPASVLPSQASSVVAVEHTKTAVDFMTDPQKGKIFFDYFGKLKEKIHISLRRKYNYANGSPGVVTLYFVLNSDGALLRAGVIEKESSAGDALQRIALDSLKSSAPFGVFPKDLGSGAVAFNLKVYFDDLE